MVRRLTDFDRVKKNALTEILTKPTINLKEEATN